jgi:hypothetical protein
VSAKSSTRESAPEPLGRFELEIAEDVIEVADVDVRTPLREVVRLAPECFGMKRELPLVGGELGKGIWFGVRSHGGN